MNRKLTETIAHHVLANLAVLPSSFIDKETIFKKQINLIGSTMRDENIPCSISFGNSLFAGYVWDKEACVYKYFVSGANKNQSLPNRWKQSVVGYGKATKEQVIYMTQKLLNLPAKPHPDDVADALAVGICTTHSVNTRRDLAIQSSWGSKI